LEDIKLNVGGWDAAEGWTILDVNPGPHVDHVGDVRDLSFLPAQSCSEVYASHVLEHLSYQQEISDVLLEFHRILKPGGRLRISVPDLETLCRLFLEPQLTTRDKYEVMRMIYGGQLDPYDRHLTGMSFEILGDFMHHAGFQQIIQVPSFNLFNDSSEFRFMNVPISCNMQGIKPVF
jgi:predicted SAM-dependent methyltransferase